MSRIVRLARGKLAESPACLPCVLWEGAPSHAIACVAAMYYATGDDASEGRGCEVRCDDIPVPFGHVTYCEELVDAVGIPHTAAVIMEVTAPENLGALPKANRYAEPERGMTAMIFTGPDTRVCGAVKKVGSSIPPIVAMSEPIGDGFEIELSVDLLDDALRDSPTHCGAPVFTTSGEWLGMFVRRLGATAFCTKASRILQKI